MEAIPIIDERYPQEANMCFAFKNLEIDCFNTVRTPLKVPGVY